MTEDSKPLSDAGMDWTQVRLNGGPPCFMEDSDGILCGRAERWPGHPEMHTYLSLAEFLQARSAADRKRIEQLERAFRTQSGILEVSEARAEASEQENARLRQALEELIAWLDDDTLEIMKDTQRMGITFDWSDISRLREKIEAARKALNGE